MPQTIFIALEKLEQVGLRIFEDAKHLSPKNLCLNCISIDYCWTACPENKKPSSKNLMPA
ncbi:hypothetical protein ACFLY6_00015 [Candidatus Dependentiae bacterium]